MSADGGAPKTALQLLAERVARGEVKPRGSRMKINLAAANRFIRAGIGVRKKDWDEGLEASRRSRGAGDESPAPSSTSTARSQKQQQKGSKSGVRTPRGRGSRQRHTPANPANGAGGHDSGTRSHVQSVGTTKPGRLNRAQRRAMKKAERQARKRKPSTQLRGSAGEGTREHGEEDTMDVEDILERAMLLLQEIELERAALKSLTHSRNESWTYEARAVRKKRFINAGRRARHQLVSRRRGIPYVASDDEEVAVERLQRTCRRALQVVTPVTALTDERALHGVGVFG